MDRFFEGLDREQKEAVFSSSRIVLVVAPPGSGKTRVLVARFLHLIERDVAPSSIVAVTFTNRASLEMKQRVSTLLPFPPHTLNINTFHRLCLGILRRELGGFVLCSRDGQIAHLRELGIRNPEAGVERISRLKNLLFHGYRDATRDELELLSQYQNRLEERGELDLDDLILRTIRLLEEDPVLLETYRERFTHILVDEYQDINPPQSRLIRLLVGNNGGLFAIGDPDQSIYNFRGANLRGFLEFREHYPDASILTLSTNYRSAKRIVHMSSSVIQKNTMRMDRAVKSIRDGGDVMVVECTDEKDEGEFIVREIESIMGGLTSLTTGREKEGFRFSDLAVLYRTNSQKDALREVFSRCSIPYRIIGEKDDSFKSFADHLKGITPEGVSLLSDLIKKEAILMGMDEGTTELLTHRASFYDTLGIEEGLRRFYEDLLFMEPQDTYDVEADRVTLMTIHMAKGLEFQVVFIAGCNEGLLPLAMRDTDLEEERRLLYVAITRAKEKVYLLFTKKRRMWGEVRETPPSRFIDDIPRELVTMKRTARKKTKKRMKQHGLFE